MVFASYTHLHCVRTIVMPELLTAAFNQDYTCVAVGSQHGYSIYNCDPFQRVYTKGTSALETR